MLYHRNQMNQSSDIFGANQKTQKINRPLNAFPIDLLLLSIDICQGVMCIYFKINVLKTKKK